MRLATRQFLRRPYIALLLLCLGAVIVQMSSAAACTVFQGSATIASDHGELSIAVGILPMATPCPPIPDGELPAPCSTQLPDSTYKVNFVGKPTFAKGREHHECMPESPNVPIGTLTVSQGRGRAAIILPPSIDPNDQSAVCIATPDNLLGNERLIVVL